jgi:hypothetical protein
MLTLTEAAKLPPPPVQVSVNVVAALSALVIALPLGGSLPLQPPEAVHAVALVELQLSVVAAPLTTEAGLAVSAIVGGEGATTVTVTVDVAGAVPAPPAHVSVKLVVAFSGPVLALPLVGSAPLQPPEAVHAVAFAELHISVAALPVCTVVGFAFSVAVGVTAIVTAAVAGELPVAPVQLSVKVVAALSAGVVKVPLVGSVPLQPPDAVHAVAFVELQLRVAVPPVSTLIVSAFSATLGDGSVCAGDDDDPPEPQPPRITAHASVVAQTRWLRGAGGRWFANRCARRIPRRAEWFFFVILPCPSGAGGRRAQLTRVRDRSVCALNPWPCVGITLKKRMSRNQLFET